jgi:hypothetical protein
MEKERLVTVVALVAMPMEGATFNAKSLLMAHE